MTSRRGRKSVEVLLLLVGFALSTTLVAGCAVGLCCAPLGLAALGASSKAGTDSALVREQTLPTQPQRAAQKPTGTLTLVVEGLPRRGDFL